MIIARDMPVSFMMRFNFCYNLYKMALVGERKVMRLTNVIKDLNEADFN